MVLSAFVQFSLHSTTLYIRECISMWWKAGFVNWRVSARPPQQWKQQQQRGNSSATELLYHSALNTHHSRSHTDSVNKLYVNLQLDDWEFYFLRVQKIEQFRFNSPPPTTIYHHSASHRLPYKFLSSSTAPVNFSLCYKMIDTGNCWLTAAALNGSTNCCPYVCVSVEIVYVGRRWIGGIWSSPFGFVFLFFFLFRCFMSLRLQPKLYYTYVHLSLPGVRWGQLLSSMFFRPTFFLF